LHVAVRRTRTSKEKLYFEIDKYDLYHVPKEIAKTEQLIWKANYLGSGHLYHLLKRLHGLRPLEKYLKEKKKNDGWEFGEGYIIGKNPTQKASHLTNKRMIPTDKYIGDVINENDIKVENANRFYRTAERSKKIFKKPHVLIKEDISLSIAFREDDLIFKHRIMGIYAPEKYQKELANLRNRIISKRDLYQALLLSRSALAGISRSEKVILKSDIMALPYPHDLNKLRLSNAEKIICNDIINYYKDQLGEGEDAKINMETAGRCVLTSFGETFCTSLNSIYKEKSKEFYPLEPIESVSFICFPFAYGNPNKPKKMSKSEEKQIEKGDLRCLIENQQDANILYKRIIKLYHQRDMVYLAKPKTLRYWLKSIAMRDANEVFTDLVSSGY